MYAGAKAPQNCITSVHFIQQSLCHVVLCNREYGDGGDDEFRQTVYLELDPGLQRQPGVVADEYPQANRSQ